MGICLVWLHKAVGRSENRRGAIKIQDILMKTVLLANSGERGEGVDCPPAPLFPTALS